MIKQAAPGGLAHDAVEGVGLPGARLALVADDLVLHGGDEGGRGAAFGQLHLGGDARQQRRPPAAITRRHGQAQIAGVAQRGHVLGRQRPGAVGGVGPRGDAGRQRPRHLYNVVIDVGIHDVGCSPDICAAIFSPLPRDSAAQNAVAQATARGMPSLSGTRGS